MLIQIFQSSVSKQRVNLNSSHHPAPRHQQKIHLYLKWQSIYWAFPGFSWAICKLPLETLSLWLGLRSRYQLGGTGGHLHSTAPWSRTYSVLSYLPPGLWHTTHAGGLGSEAQSPKLSGGCTTRSSSGSQVTPSSVRRCQGKGIGTVVHRVYLVLVFLLLSLPYPR